MNKAIIYGNLTRDPELKQLPSGGQIATFGMATNRRIKRDDEYVDVPEFHSIVVFGKQAENCALYLTKGSSALVEGRIQTRSWDSPEKGKQYRTEIVAEHVQFGPRKSGKEDKYEQQDIVEYPEEATSPDDIPF